MKEVISEIFQKIPINRIFASIWLFACVFVILPRPIIKNLGMLEFKEQWQFVFSLSFIILTCYGIVGFVVPKVSNMIEKIQLKRKVPIMKQQLCGLTSELAVSISGGIA